MGYLRDFRDYLKQNYDRDLFQEFKIKQELLKFHLAGQQEVRGKIVNNLVFDFEISDETGKIQRIPKLTVKYFYPAPLDEKVSLLIDVNSEIADQHLQPIIKPHLRNHVKNKTLYPLMKEHEAVIITLYEGEIIRGFIDNFTRYELIVKFNENLHIILLRHAIQLFRTFKGRDLLKKFQEQVKDWKKSSLWVEKKDD